MDIPPADGVAVRRSLLPFPLAVAFTAAGFGAGMMPEDYAQRIAPRDLQALIAFIRAGLPD